MTSDSPNSPSSGAKSPASPLLPVLAYTVLTAAYVVMNRDTPQPDASGQEVLAYAQSHGTAINLGALLLAAAAVALVCAAPGLLRSRAAEGRTYAWALGSAVLAAVALAASGVFALLGGRLPANGDPAEARDLADLAFLAGGPAFAATLGLFIAGVTLRNAPLPGGLRVPGFVLAAAGLLSLLAPAVAAFGYLLPLVRFGGLIWLIAAAVTVRRSGRTAVQTNL